MLEVILVIGMGLIPPLMSLWVMRRVEAQARESLRAAMNAASVRSLHSLRLSPEHHYVEGVGYMVGDITCRYNARSSYIRCTVNPYGPCHQCPYHELIEFA